MIFFPCHLLSISQNLINGEMSEWSKEHVWKACIPQGILGSNPSLSAIFRFAKNGEISPATPKLGLQFWSGRRIRQLGNIMYYVYVLLNEDGTRTYTGVTDDVRKRLALHNAGRVKASRPYRPYKIVHIESFDTLKEAMGKEKFYKSTTGRRRLKDMFFK